MISFPNAKINIGLCITAKRLDGYHEIETILYPIPFCDVLEIREAKQTRLHNLGRIIDNIDEDKVSVVRAYHLLKTAFNLPPIEILLYKNIPFGAGLGGGSADAAFMLKLMNDYFKLALTNDQLVHYAGLLGSDDPFFIRNNPQIARGRGELLHPIPLDLSGYYFVLLYPQIQVSTVAAFSGVKPKEATIDLNSLIEIPIEKWKMYVKNDFESSVFQRYPLLEKIKNSLYDEGALYASMSGSGSALFGLFDKKVKLSKDLEEYLLWEGVLQK